MSQWAFWETGQGALPMCHLFLVFQAIMNLVSFGKLLVSVWPLLTHSIRTLRHTSEECPKASETFDHPEGRGVNWHQLAYRSGSPSRHLLFLCLILHLFFEKIAVKSVFLLHIQRKEVAELLWVWWEAPYGKGEIIHTYAHIQKKVSNITIETSVMVLKIKNLWCFLSWEDSVHTAYHSLACVWKNGNCNTSGAFFLSQC